MGGGGLSDEVERFLVQYVPTVGHLEAILLLRRHENRGWSVAQLAESLFVERKSAAAIARHLCDHGFVTDDGSGTLRYAPPTALAHEVDAVAESYRERLVAVSQFIHARQDAVNIRGFADAFRFRKD
jgi:DNA-binding IclR family transcriptional regulator